MSTITSILVITDIRDRLSELKVHPGESYEDVIRRLVENSTDDKPLSDETLRGIEESLADIKAGRVFFT